VIEAAQSQLKPPSDDFEVWEENWETLLFFLAVSTQWNVAAGMGGLYYVGMRHEGIAADMAMRGIRGKKAEALAETLRGMEQAALEVLNTRP
jgi:hypothetical protein